MKLPKFLQRNRGEPEDAATDMLTAICSGPLLVDASRVQDFVAGVAAISPNLWSDPPSVGASDDDGFWSGWRAYYRPYQVDRNGILTIPVQGALVDGLSMNLGSVASGYPYLSRAWSRGMADPDVSGVILDISSPGGQAGGNFELVDAWAANKTKPVAAVANGVALSGAYSLASVADQLLVRMTGMVGSVGSVSVHRSIARALDEAGIDVSVFRAGRRKAETNPLEPLTPMARAGIQAEADRIRDIFVQRVARNRRMTEDAVRATEAAILNPEEGIRVGFADAVGGIEEARQWLRDQPAMPSGGRGNRTGTVAAAVAAERARNAEVMASADYRGRETLAGRLLAETAMTAAEIVQTLAVSPAPNGSGNGAGMRSRSHFNEAVDRGLFEGLAEREDEDEMTNGGQLWPGRARRTVEILSAARAAGQWTNDDRQRAEVQRAVERAPRVRAEADKLEIIAAKSVAGVDVELSMGAADPMPS